MRTKNIDIELKSQEDVVYLYWIGDVHLGAANCAEGHFRAFVNYVAKKKRAYWLGGGDYCNCILPSDLKRFDFQGLPNWLFKGDPVDIKEALTDIAKQERDRFCEIVDPIKDKCLGLIEGNHEYRLMQHAHNAHHYVMCNELGVDNLTDCCFLRLRFKVGRKVRVLTLFAVHGMGGGRTDGAEPNHLGRIARWVDADIILRGHAHSFFIAPPEPRLFIPRSGVLPDECMEKTVYKANGGCWLKSLAAGPSTYDSRANYPPRPLTSLEISIKPFHSIRLPVLGRRIKHTKVPVIRIGECPY